MRTLPVVPGYFVNPRCVAPVPVQPTTTQLVYVTLFVGPLASVQNAWTDEVRPEAMLTASTRIRSKRTSIGWPLLTMPSTEYPPVPGPTVMRYPTRESRTYPPP